jgi:hypothetical protein
MPTNEATMGVHEMKARASVAEARKDPNINMPGREGVQARMMNELVNTFFIAIAKESDRGSGSVDIIAGTSSALGVIAAGLARNFAETGFEVEIFETVLSLAERYGSRVVHGTHPEGTTLSFTIEPSGHA